MSKLPNPSNKYGVLSVAQYYGHLGLTKTSDLLPTEKDYVLKILRDINTSKAAGIDRLPGRFLKDCTDVLAKPVTDICNLSISLNKFPRTFKLPKVKPIFKKGRKTNVSNYRPISLLPILSKVIEEVVHEQTTKFLNDNNIFYKYQSDFRSNHSTDLFLSFLNDKILKGFDNGMYIGMILTDLQRAFDTINHKILIDKLLPIGFSKNAISWYESNLVERHFTVEVANRVSKFANISRGVPQGSVLGPLLFLICVNDMSQAVECDLYLYADDSCLLFQHKSVTEIKKELTKDFSNICDWFVDNKPSIRFGEDKTKSILFSSKRNLKLIEELDIRYKEIKIKQHKHVNYLGCVLDETMSGETMALRVIKKINSRLKFLYQKILFLDIPLRRLLCNALFQRHFDYACTAWYPQLTKKLKDKLQVTQCIRFCLKLQSR